MTRRPSDHRATFRGGARAGRGSAYLFTLMVLVILTIAGLALSLITQTEQQLGANERSMLTTFYAADSGVAIGTARAVAINVHDPLTVITDRKLVGTSQLANQILISPFQQILPMPCNYCEITQGFQYVNVNHAVNATSRRLAWGNEALPPADSRVLGRASVGSMIELSPWQANLEFAVREISDEDEKIRF
jgi:hypothetical protein